MDIRMPKLGMEMTEAVLSRWLVSDGDAVDKGQPIYELETRRLSQRSPHRHRGNCVESQMPARPIRSVSYWPISTPDGSPPTEKPWPRWSMSQSQGGSSGRARVAAPTGRGQNRIELCDGFFEGCR